MSAAASFACNTYAYTLSHDAKSCLAHLANHGFREFELMIYPGHLWPAAATAGDTAALRRFVEQSGLRIVSLNMPNIDVNIAGASSEMRRYSLDLLSGVVTLAGELGVAGVVIGPGKANPLFPARASASSSISTLRWTCWYPSRGKSERTCGWRTCHSRFCQRSTR
jgi:sugar phosphate isomerase/epimerase